MSRRRKKKPSVLEQLFGGPKKTNQVSSWCWFLSRVVDGIVVGLHDHGKKKYSRELLNVTRNASDYSHLFLENWLFGFFLASDTLHPLSSGDVWRVAKRSAERNAQSAARNQKYSFTPSHIPVLMRCNKDRQHSTQNIWACCGDGRRNRERRKQDQARPEEDGKKIRGCRMCVVLLSFRVGILDDAILTPSIKFSTFQNWHSLAMSNCFSPWQRNWLVRCA